MSIEFYIVIPSRFQATRLPGKPLRVLAGKTLIEWVYQRAIQCAAKQVIIATDDMRIEKAARGFGANICMTAASHASGTDRLAEVALQQQWSDDSIVVNLQGDEPLIEPQLVQQVANDLASSPQADIATLATPIHTFEEYSNPNAVKLVTNNAGYALYFSRAPIPWSRQTLAWDKFANPTAQMREFVAKGQCLRHIGLYAYRVGFLKKFSALNTSVLENTESLEQLRALEHGFKIKTSITLQPPGQGVDTEEDLQYVEKLLLKR